jgi:hypothetical protein
MKCVSKPRASETMEANHLNYFIHYKENVILCSPAEAHRRFGEPLATYFSYFLIGLLFDPEGGSSTVIRNIGGFLPEYMALYCRRLHPSQTVL